LILLVLFSLAQEITGRVENEKTREPIPFASIQIQGTYQGTITNSDGNYKLAVSTKDTLIISSVGYIPRKICVADFNNNSPVITLKEDVITLDEVTVKPQVPRAKVLFNELIKHKKENQKLISQVNNYKTLETNAVYIAVDSSSRITKAFHDIEEVTVNMENYSLRFSPVYLLEKAQSIINDSINVVYKKVDGIFPQLNQAFESLILKDVIVNLDFYKEQISILDRGFISPLANVAPMYYNLYLNDSTTIDSIKYFNFSFVPKNKFNQLFTGHFTIADSSFALTQIDAYISKDANLNFVNGFEAHVNYKKLAGDTWFYNDQKIGINLTFNPSKDSLSRYSSKRMAQVSKGNWLINTATHYTTSLRLDRINSSAWKNQPEFSGDQLNIDAYSRVDRLKQHEVIKGIDKVGGMVLTSFVNAGKIDIGPVFDIYSTNAIEGSRFSFPLRTSEKMFKYFSVGGLLGYGTESKEVKYGMNMVYQPMKTDKLVFRLNYSNDYSLISQDKYLRFIKNNPNNRGTGNFIAVFTSTERNPYLKEERNYELRMEYNAPNSIHFEMSPYFLKSISTPNVHFVQNNIDYPQYNNYGVFLDIKFTFRQKYDKYYFDRVYYVNPTPVVNICWDLGQTLLPDGSMKSSGLYSQFHGSIQGRINMGQIFMNYIMNAGYLFGKAPYDLLDQPVGSMSLGYAKDRYNLLHFASFAHNLYSNTHIYFNGGGVLLNKIPGIRKFKLREVVSIKSHFGTLNNSYKGVFDLPGYFSNSNNEPYTEVGFGITNIFKILRFEYVTQLSSTYRDQSFTDNSGFRFRAEMSF
jgi:hypothetical protein